MKKVEYLLLPQVGPKKVGAQLHLYPLTLSTHVPPLRQGFEAHSSMLTSHLQKNSFQRYFIYLSVLGQTEQKLRKMTSSTNLR